MKTFGRILGWIIAMIAIVAFLLIAVNIVLLLIGVSGWLFTGEFYHILAPVVGPIF